MSAALHLPVPTVPPGVIAASWTEEIQSRIDEQSHLAARTRSSRQEPLPDERLIFYRKHSERMLRRYLYASMQVGRAPSILGDPIGRGWVSSRPVRTFEDAVIFVLDVENCLKSLSSLDRSILCRVVIQEYTQAEAATLLGMSVRAMSYKFPRALDRFTEKLLEAGLLILPR